MTPSVVLRRAPAGVVDAVLASAAATLCVLPVLVIAAYAANWTSAVGPAEMALFGPTGAALLDGSWAQVFADPVTQAGPLELWPFGLFQLLDLHGAWSWAIAEGLLTALLTATVLAVAFACPVWSLSRTGMFRTGLAVAGLLSLTRLLPAAIDVGHPAEVLVPVLWVAAACAARGRRWALVGVLLGLASGFEVWGVLGAPLVLCGSRPRVHRTALAGAGTLAVLYGPFVATGSFRMFGFAWPVKSHTLVARLWPDLHTFPWGLRLLQAVLVLGIGAGVVLLLRRSPAVVWLAPLALTLTRLLLDPLMYPYYFLAPRLLLVLALAWAVRHREVALGAACLALTLFLRSPAAITPTGTAGMLAVVLLVAARLSGERAAPGQRRPWPGPRRQPA